MLSFVTTLGRIGEYGLPQRERGKSKCAAQLKLEHYRNLPSLESRDSGAKARSAARHFVAVCLVENDLPAFGGDRVQKPAAPAWRWRIGGGDCLLELIAPEFLSGAIWERIHHVCVSTMKWEASRKTACSQASRDWLKSNDVFRIKTCLTREIS
jgi:hypothetical protein